MAFAVKYRCEFTTIKGRSVKVDIEEDGYGGAIVPLTAFGEDALFIKSPNGEFDKLTGIRESYLELSVCSSSTISALDFITDSDTQYKVKVYINNVVEWVGWLDNDQLSETFIDTITEIKLTANDGLSLLKNIPLSNVSDAQIWGIDRIKKYIGFCLNKTDLGLRWNSLINMYPKTVDQRGVDPDFDAFYYAHLTSFTFLTGPRDFDDCFTVLSKIMEAFHCTLFQARGEWYIIHTPDRIANRLDGVGRADAADSDSNTSITNVNYAFDIGITRDQKLKDADALLSVAKPNKFVNLQYEFKLPAVYFRNFDFLDGDQVVPLSTAARPVFNLDHWTEVVNDTYVAVEINTGNQAELQRYIVQYPVVTYSDATVQPRARTTSFFVTANDKIRFGYTTREKNQGFVNSSQFNYLVLSDGVTTYYLDDDGKWYTGSVKAIGYQWAAAEDRRLWRTYEITTDVLPISGFVYFELSSIGNSRTASNEVHYKDLQFEVIPYINETQYIKGYKQRSEQAATLKLDYDNQLYMSRVDNASFQGSILDDSYESIPDWKYYSALDATAVTFEKYITRSYWKVVYRNYLKMEINLFNLYSSRLISLLNTVRFDQIADKEFMITTMNSNIIQEESQMTLIEIRDTSTTDDFDEIAATEAFRFIPIQEEILNEVPENKKPLDFRFGPIGLIFGLLQRRKRRNFNNYK